MSHMKNKIIGSKYELHPYKEVKGFDNQAWMGTENVINILKLRIADLMKSQKKVVLCFDFYPGVSKVEILDIAESLFPKKIIDMEQLAKEEEGFKEEFNDYLTEDRVFGIICHKKLKDFFDEKALENCVKNLERETDGLFVIAGVGAGLMSRGDIYVYCNITRWEIQLRYREGMPNWNRKNSKAPKLEKYKCGFFIEWRLADRYKEERYNQFDYVLETEDVHNPKLITGEAYRAGLKVFAKQPFRLEPYFDPGVWGGHWMQEKFGLNKDKENFAWSFDGVPEENAINLKYGNIIVKMPAIDVVLYQPKELLGNRVYARFGAEFPIRFDLLDTMGGGNLSLQVHPLTKYIQDTFGMHYTQDESYYFLDVDEKEETFMYLGVKENVDKAAMERDLRRAEKGEIQFPAEKYVNKIPVKKHDHVSIPAGTIHCSGKNSMVLEISATPYIFTFKLWDWGRVDLNGIPRPIHIEHGMNNIQWDRDTKWIQEHLIHQEKTILEEKGSKIEKTGLHELEPIDTVRYEVEKKVRVESKDSVHVINLVEGDVAQIGSVDDSFEPFVIHYAETAIIPASVGMYEIIPVSGKVKVIVASIRE